MNVERHVTEDEWDELLAGETAGAAWEHVEGCAQCRAELAELRGAVRGFAALSLEQAEAEAARRVSPAAVRAAAAKWRPAEPAWWATAAAAMLAVGLFGAAHVRGGAGAMERQAAGVESRQQIAEDNKLMGNIDAELKWEQGGAVQMPAGSLRAQAE